MPVESKRIKGRLKVLFPKANLSKKRLDALAARLAKKPADDADDDAIDEILKDANDVYPFEEMGKDEHRIVTAENKLKKQQQNAADDDSDDDSDDDEPEDPKKDKSKDNDQMPAWAKKLSQDIAEIKTGKITESKKEAARKLFIENETFKAMKEKGQEHFFNQIDVNSETPVEEQISNLEETYKEIVQVQADSGDFAGRPPLGGGGAGEPSTEELDAIVDDM